MISDRIAGAPISWGVCEVPGWGYQLTPERVLSEMRDAGLKATEFGPDEFLPSDPAQKASTLASYGLAAVGGFVPAVLHDPSHDPTPVVDRALDGFVAAGAGVLVLAAVTGEEGYDERPTLDARAWNTLFDNVDRLSARAKARGILLTLHPHVGTVVEREYEVRRVLEGSSVPLCVDTGHLMIGGTDPLALVREVPDRIRHMHLKDVDASWAKRVQQGEVTYTDAVRSGMYRPLGRGNVDVAGIVGTLERAGYTGWYVMEQDTILTGAPEGQGPLADVLASVAYLRGLDG
ncbi:sugar phosphate isomerase/epimerase [Pendulispora rubella]|uniref:Sugar phosphate isomerase/epimerase n=1 Tax=Pendulispora rubella TaxID=2741070 RepID=A0ABZ2L275_9BACT